MITPGKNYNEAHNFRGSLGEKMESNLKLLKRAREAEGETSPSFFLKIEKVPQFWEKSPDCVHLSIKFYVQNVVLKVSCRKKLQTLSLRFLCFIDEMLNEVP